jgi:hypothetical protein
LRLILASPAGAAWVLGCPAVGFILSESVIQESTINERRTEFFYAGVNDV